MFNVSYDLLLTRKITISEKNSLITLFFTLFVLSRASDNTTSQNIGGGAGAGGVPHLKFLGGRPPVPLGLRPVWGQPGHVLAIIEKRPCIYHFYHLLPPIFWFAHPIFLTSP